MKKASRYIRIVLGIICLCGMLYCLVSIINYSIVGNVEKVYVFVEPKDLDGTEKCYLDNDKLYVINTEIGQIHIFNGNGDFVKGFQLPTNGGNIYCGMKDKLYVYCFRTDMLIEIKDNNIDSQTEVYYSNPDEFYSVHNLTNGNELKLVGNEVYFSKDSNETIKLNVGMKKQPIPVYFLILSINFFFFLWLVGPKKIHAVFDKFRG